MDGKDGGKLLDSGYKPGASVGKQRQCKPEGGLVCAAKAFFYQIHMGLVLLVWFLLFYVIEGILTRKCRKYLYFSGIGTILAE